ncbi:MAG: TonB-dependent receptor, partial [Methylocystis sp.]|nr:TonB-dependent receptor [Methylocystis sp.]
GFDYAVTPDWKIGADVVYASGPYLRGDEINFFPPLPPYATVNLRTSYQVTNNVQLYGLIENAGNTKTRSFGTFFNTMQIPFLAFVDPRQVAIGPPLGVYGGAKVSF